MVSAIDDRDREIIDAHADELSAEALDKEGLLHDSSVHCDELVSLQMSRLTRFVGVLDTDGLTRLDGALRVALGINPGGDSESWYSPA